MNLFADHVAEKHVNALMRELPVCLHSFYYQRCPPKSPFTVPLFSLPALLIRANSMPFHVQPSTMAGVVKGLYSLRPGEL